jgi:hypothetical protein
MAKPVGIKMREKWEEILFARQQEITHKVHAAEQALKAKIKEDVKRDFGLETAIGKRSKLKAKHHKAIDQTARKLTQLKEQLKQELKAFDEKIAAAYGSTYVPSDEYSDDYRHDFAHQFPSSLIDVEVENRLNVQNGAIRKLETTFRDARESIWTSDAPTDFRSMLDQVKVDADKIMITAEKKAPKLPAPKKPAIGRK